MALEGGAPTTKSGLKKLEKLKALADKKALSAAAAELKAATAAAKEPTEGAAKKEKARFIITSTYAHHRRRRHSWQMLLDFHTGWPTQGISARLSTLAGSAHTGDCY